MREVTYVPIYSIRKEDTKCITYICDRCAESETFITGRNEAFDENEGEWTHIYKIGHITIDKHLCPDCVVEVFGLNREKYFPAKFE